MQFCQQSIVALARRVANVRSRETNDKVMERNPKEQYILQTQLLL